VAPPAVRALVLAAGRGERLRPLTAAIPKPLLPVAGRPLAAWTLDRLAAAGCGAAALNLHHLGAAIRAAFGERCAGLPLVYSEERDLLGTGGALPPLAEFLGAARAVLLVNGDSLCRWPFERLLRAHRSSGAAATLLVHRTADPRLFGGGVAVERGRIVAFRRGALAWDAARTKRVFAGAAVLAPELVARLPPGPSDIVAALYEPLLAAGARIAAVATSRPWFDLGTPGRYLVAALAWGLAGLPERGARIVSGATVDPTARLRRAVVEAGARVAAGARLAESLAMPGAAVGAGARLVRVVVGPGAAVAEGEVLSGCLLTADAEGRRVATPLGE
jgi:NDP-sugar pyrophosphorylase family protein